MFPLEYICSLEDETRRHKCLEIYLLHKHIVMVTNCALDPAIQGNNPIYIALRKSFTEDVKANTDKLIRLMTQLDDV